MLELACVGAWSDGVSLALLDADDMSMRRLLVDGYVCDIYDDLAARLVAGFLTSARFRHMARSSSVSIRLEA
jgi:hypothetical protein